MSEKEKEKEESSDEKEEEKPVLTTCLKKKNHFLFDQVCAKCFKDFFDCDECENNPKTFCPDCIEWDFSK